MSIDPAAVPAVPLDTAEDLYENAPCGYVSTLPGGLITRVNRTFLAWTGYAHDEIVMQRRLQDLLPPGARVFYETHQAPLLAMQGQVRGIAVDVVSADGRRLPMLVNAVLDRDDAGTPKGVRTVLFDAADRRAYERELLRQRRAAEVSEGRMRVLQGLTAALAAAVDAGRVATVLREELSPHLDVEGIALAELDEDTGALVSRGPGRTPGEGAAEVLRSRTPVFRDRTALLPLATGERPLGVLRLDFPAGPEFDPAERDFLLTVAAQCAQALDRARLLAEITAAGRRAAQLADLSHALIEVRTVAGRADRLVTGVVPDLADRAAVDLVTASGVDRVAGAPDTGAPPAAVQAALTSGEPQLVPGPPAAVVLPLRVREHVLGALTLVSAGARRYRERDLPFLTDLAGRAAVALENVRVFEWDREVARVLQLRLLSGRPPADPRVEIRSWYRSAVENLEVGGDWYDTFLVAPDVLAVVVGDVVGRGVGAASTMGQLRSAIRALAGTGVGPAGVLRQLDRYVEHVDDATMATVVYAELDLAAGRMRYAAAGHVPPVLAAPDSPPELLWDGRSTPLGVQNGDRPEAEVTLTPGTRLLLYTDGLVERRGASVGAGLDRLTAEVGARRGAPLTELVDGVTDTLLASNDRADDVCVLAVAYRG